MIEVPEGGSVIHVTLPPASTARLHELCALSGATNVAQVLANALRLYEYAVSVVEDGGTVLARTSDGQERALLSQQAPGPLQ